MVNLIEIGEQFMRVGHIDGSDVGFIYQHWQEIADKLNLDEIKNIDGFNVTSFLALDDYSIFVLEYDNIERTEYYVVKASTKPKDDDEEEDVILAEFEIISHDAYDNKEKATREMCREFTISYDRAKLKVVT